MVQKMARGRVAAHHVGAEKGYLQPVAEHLDLSKGKKGKKKSGSEEKGEKPVVLPRRIRVPKKAREEEVTAFGGKKFAHFRDPFNASRKKLRGEKGGGVFREGGKKKTP